MFIGRRAYCQANHSTKILRSYFLSMTLFFSMSIKKYFILNLENIKIMKK